MIKVQSNIKGESPLMMDRLDVDDIINPKRQPRKYTEEVLQAMGEKAIYRNEHGLYFPSRNVKKCLIEGARTGRMNLKGTQRLAPFIEALVGVQPQEILFGKNEPDDYIQFPMRTKRGDVIPKRLPIMKDWELTFTLLIFDDQIVDRVNEALVFAGFSVGLGNQRPEYGRFEVVEWKIIK